MKKIIYTRPDGGVSVVIPTGAIPIEEVLVKDVPSDAINPQIVEDTDLPSDRTNRDCWEVSGKKVVVNHGKVNAKEAEKAKKIADKNAVFSKLKISKEEFERIGKANV